MGESIEQPGNEPGHEDEHNLIRILSNALRLDRDNFLIFYNNLRIVLYGKTDNLRFETDNIVIVINSFNAWRILRILKELPGKDDFKTAAVETLVEELEAQKSI